MPRRDTLSRNQLAAKRIGRRTAYTENRATVILNAIESGNHITTACALAGIDRSTLYRWLERAETVTQAIETGQPYEPDWAQFCDFRDRLLRARAEAEQRMVGAVTRDACGGVLIEEKPVMETIEGDTRVARDDDGNILYGRKWTTPNGRIALAYLARSAPEKWGERQRLELTGSDGESLFPGLPAAPPFAVSAEDEITDPDVVGLTARLALVARERREGMDLLVEPEASQ